MPNRRRTLIITILGLIVLAVAVVLAVGPERLWERFGPADLGDVEFATLVRRDQPNDALACLPEYCEAKIDIPAPVIAKPQADVFLAVQQALAGEPGLEQVAGDAAAGTLRYVQRSKLMRFPDTISVQVMPASGGGSAVLLYSRSQLGKSDFGVNRARLERWIGLIQAAAQK